MFKRRRRHLRPIRERGEQNIDISDDEEEHADRDTEHMAGVSGNQVS